MANAGIIISCLLFNHTDGFSIFIRCLYILGAFKLFEKSGIESWWALIPWAREYQLSRCANREPEGRVYCVLCFFITMSKIGANLAITVPGRTGSFWSDIFTVVLLTLSLIYFSYNVRIFSGFTEVYRVKKTWLFLCIFEITLFIPMLVWGLKKKYQPTWKVPDIEAEMKRLETEGNAEFMEQGLTVNIRKRTTTEFFRRKLLLRDIHMAIPRGRLVLLLGGSGAGKTTYLNAVIGYEKADAEILLNGKDVYKDYKQMQYKVGYVPQSDMMRSKDTVFNTLLDIAMMRLPIDATPKDLRTRVNAVMDLFGLKAVQHSKIDKLSGGQRKRLSVAMEYLSNPSLFVLDEPDSGLDGVMSRKLFSHLRDIADSGKIVLVITHTPDRIISYIDDVIVLAKDSTMTGRLAFYGSVQEAREFFGCQTMEEIVKAINQKEEGGEGLADEYVLKYAEVANG